MKKRTIPRTDKRKDCRSRKGLESMVQHDFHFFCLALLYNIKTKHSEIKTGMDTLVTREILKL